jgi:FtsP/CotA-like multicopper oxidase with cupredoxin domain
MPDGIPVTMWGYALPGQEATVPGPALTVPPGDTMLTIHLVNALPQLINSGVVPTSIVVPGQVTTMTPVMFTDGAGRQRVRSFTHETAATATMDYTWTNLKPGTFLYHSGTQPQVQVQMGLYGSVVVQSAAGQAYPGVAYDNDVTLVYSEVDPALHAAVADGSYGTAPAMTSTLNYAPKYFFVNGQSYTSNTSPIALGTPGSTALLRLVNAGLETHAPMLQGAHMTLVAEDGNPYPYRTQQYLATLPAGKTMDATLTVPASGQAYPIYDRRLRVANASGMINILRSGNAPVAGSDAYSASAGTTVLNVAANGVLGNDTDADGDTLTAAIVSNAGYGNVVLNADGSFSYTPSVSFSGTDSFTIRPAMVDFRAMRYRHHHKEQRGRRRRRPKPGVELRNGRGWIRGAAGSVLLNDTDADGNTLTPTLVTNINPAQGSVVVTTAAGLHLPWAARPPVSTFTYQGPTARHDNTATVSFRQPCRWR